MIGASATKRVRVTVEVEEGRRDAVIRLLRESEKSCEIVSVRRIQPGNARKRFAVPREDEEPTAPTPIRLFERRQDATGEEAAEPAIAESRPLPQEELMENPLPKCNFCLRGPCITTSPFKPQGRGNARISNHTKRRKDYKWYWRTLKDCGLWDNPQYLERKQDLGCLIDDVREVMPHCVIKDVRNRWPNPPDVPYQGHRRS